MNEHEEHHEHHHDHEHEHDHGAEKSDLIKIIFSIIFYIIAFIVKDEITKKVLFLISYFIVGFKVLKEAAQNIFKGEIFDENFLMSVATIGALIISEFPEAVAVMLLYQIGEFFQGVATEKSKKSITDLMNIKPDTATVLVDGKEAEMLPEKVQIGAEILVKPGEKIPLDGVVIEGDSFIDTKALTGESVPRAVKVSSEVLSGSINQNGILKIKVTKEFTESTVNKILELTQNATEQKSKSENFITKFAKVYTPTVVLIAVVLAVLPPVILKDEFSKWVYRALSFLVVSCPCSLVISIPLSFFGGIGGAAKKGILVKGSNYIEKMSKAKIGVFDKTGTLTKGEFKIQEINSVGIEDSELLELTAYAENYSNHPIAKVIKDEYNKEIDKSKISDIEEISGHGIKAIVLGKEVLAGNEKLMKKENIDFEPKELAGTVIYVAVDKKYSGYILISDKIKDDAIEAIKSLKKAGIEKTVMLTGDNEKVAIAVAKELRIDETYSELLPTDKVQKIKEIIENKRKDDTVFFVGDGINDSPVLAISDIGIAMGGIGQDSAIEAADLVLMTDEPSKIATAIKLSKKNMKIVKENILFSIFVKILVLVLSALGITNLWLAVFADVGVSVIAILNALRMLK